MVLGHDRDEAERLAAARRERGIQQDAFVGDADAALAWLARLADAGAGWAILLAAGGIERAELVAERVLPRLRAGVGS
jgi:alkanesulfonate monooxygenase SsuD/methylene tetrahydromethanopterin reductase-like flavin-dependent oxidoreductase (luciferase family)